MSAREDNIVSGLSFLRKLKSNHLGWYWEVSDPTHSDYRIWPQSQYLLYLTFKRFGKFDLACEIYYANDFKTSAVDRDLCAASRFCVLDNDAPPFYLASQTGLPDNYDEVALLGHYQFLSRNRSAALKGANFLKSKWNQQFGVLGMDDGDEKAGLFRVYKTALAGTLFARVGMTEDCESAANTLRRLQSVDGGWVTDLDSTGKPNGVTNIETTCLTLICLDCADRGRYSPLVDTPQLRSTRASARRLRRRR